MLLRTCSTRILNCHVLTTKAYLPISLIQPSIIVHKLLFLYNVSLMWVRKDKHTQTHFSERYTMTYAHITLSYIGTVIDSTDSTVIESIDFYKDLGIIFGPPPAYHRGYCKS